MTEDPLIIDIWLWTLRRRSDDARVLSEDELARAQRFAFERDRDRYIAGRARLRRLLGRYAGRQAETLPLRRGRDGKPELDGLPFNLSHTNDLAALAVVRSGGRWRLGVDIETERPIELGVADIAFSDKEQQALRAASPGERQTATFFAGWTRKEAYLKAVGSGLLAPLKDFDVDMRPNSVTPEITIRNAAEVGSGWRLVSFDACRGVPGAIAIDSGDQPLRLKLRRITT